MVPAIFPFLQLDLNEVGKYVIQIVSEVAVWKTIKPDPKKRAIPEKLLPPPPPKKKDVLALRHQ